MVESLISFADILPTLCEAADIHPDKYKTDGKSFLNLISGKEDKIQDEVFIHYTVRWGNKQHNRWVMNDEYKLYQDGRFFNTAKDTLEKNPIQKITDYEKELKEQFQNILYERENDIPFNLNDTTFNVNY